MDPNSNIVKELQESFGDTLPACEMIVGDEIPADRIVGAKDESGKQHGETEIYYKNGDHFWGDYRHGLKEGMASVVLKNGDNFIGRFKDNHLDGFVVETVSFCERENVTREVFYKQGVRHGTLEYFQTDQK